jgi:hypothetical protein
VELGKLADPSGGGSVMPPLASKRATCRSGRLLAAAAAGALGLFLPPALARAGTIAEVFCRTPAGAPAPIEGWEEGWSGAAMPFAGDANQCATRGPLSSVVYDTEPQPASSGPLWRYTPPAGYTLTGGQVLASFYVPGGGNNFTGAAALLGPRFGFDEADFIGGDPGGTPGTYEGDYGLTGHTGGSLWIYAFCEPPNDTCPAGDSSQPYWALAEVHSAILELSETDVPQATGFGGNLIAGVASGTAQLSFAASEPAPGPGIYQATVQIDGKTLYQGTPDGNEGHCAPIGRNANGVPEFLYATPCPLAEQIDLPINTTGLPDGLHQLKVGLTDAAGVTETVYDAPITTANRTSVSALLDSPATQALAGEAARYAIVLTKRSTALGSRLRRAYSQSAVSLAGQLRDSATGIPAAGVMVTLSEDRRSSPAGSSRVLAQTTTDAAGNWDLHAGRGPSRALHVSYGPEAGEGITIQETVRPSLALRVETPGGGRIVFSGQMKIRPLGSPRPLVSIQTRAASGWETVGVPIRVRGNGDYRYVFESSPLTLGRRFAFRATTPQTILWQSTSSPTREAVIR